MAIHPSAYEYVLPFGKFKGKSFGYLAEMYPDYLDWLSGTAGLPVNARTAAARTRLGEAIGDLNLPTSVVHIPDKPTPPMRVDMWYIEKRDSIGLRFTLQGDMLDRFKAAVDGRKWNAEDGHWEFPVPQLIKTVEFFGGPKKINLTESVKAQYLKEYKRAKELDEIRNKKSSDLEIPTLLPLRDYQTVNVEFGVRAGGRFLCADAPGLGKTPSAIGFSLVMGGKTLVVMPKSVKLQWAAEIKKFSGHDVCVWEGNGPQHNIKAQFHVINYDIVAKFIKELNKLKFNNLICDEATKLKNYKSVRYKAIAGSWKERKEYPGLKIENVMLLTGTPILNRPMELYTLLSFLDKKRFNNPVHFKERYEGTGFGTTRAQNLDELHERTKQLIIRHTKDQVADELPKKARANVLIEMTPEEKKAYNKHLDALFRKWKLNGKPSAAHMPAIRDYLFNLKFPRIIEFIDDMLEADQPVLVFTIQQKHAEMIAKHYGDNARLLHGGITSSKAREQIKLDLKEGRAKVGVFTIIAGGMGIDGLQYAMSDCLFADRWWVPADHEQAEDRLNRLGQTKSAMNYYLTIKDTIDEDMAAVLDKKQIIIDQAVDGKSPITDQELSKIRGTSIFNEVVKRAAARRHVEMADADEVIE